MSWSVAFTSGSSDQDALTAQDFEDAPVAPPVFASFEAEPHDAKKRRRNSVDSILFIVHTLISNGGIISRER